MVAAHQADAAAPTLAEFAHRYLDEHARPFKKPRSVEEDERNLRLHIIPALGKLKLKDITSTDIAKFHAAARHAPTNANRCRALLSHMFKMAEVWEVRRPGSNPCQHVQKYREHPRERYLSAEELGRFADAIEGAEEREPPGAIAAIRLLILTGCRKSEILKLRWEWVDFERGCLVLPDSVVTRAGAKPVSIGKRGPKTAPLGAVALRAITELPRQQDSPYVLPAERGDGHFVGVQKVWQRIRKAAGLDDIRIHVLRHSFASVAVSSGDSLYLIGKVLGHRQTRTTERYAHLIDNPHRAVAERTSEKIAALMDGTKAPNIVELPSAKRAVNSVS